MRLVCAANLRDGKEIRMLCGRQRHMVTSGERKKGALFRQQPSSAKGNDPSKEWTEVAAPCVDRRNCFIVGNNPSPPTCVMRPSWECAELACCNINGSAESACQMFLEPMKEARHFFFFLGPQVPFTSILSLGRFFYVKSTVAGGFAVTAIVTCCFAFFPGQVSNLPRGCNR